MKEEIKWVLFYDFSINDLEHQWFFGGKISYNKQQQKHPTSNNGTIFVIGLIALPCKYR